MNETRYPELEILGEPFKKMQESVDAEKKKRMEAEYKKIHDNNNSAEAKAQKETNWSFDGTNITIEFKNVSINVRFKCHDDSYKWVKCKDCSI